ncbi:hypothetical protein BDY24DRAFT_411492 [Mrakia frigida]|uniref:uncharacterized protein n=1 Tax=Mrakia frigida TaxID=29902 RepID=UPI003FCC1EB0
MSNILDVETEEARQERLSKLFSSQSLPTPPPGLLTRPTTFPVPENSELLSRLQSFLPLMASANEALATADLEELDIENVGEGEEQYVEMDLGLGVFDARLAGEEGEGSGSDSSDEDEDASDEDSSEEDDEEEESATAATTATATPSILDLRNSSSTATGGTKKGKKPGIEVLGEKEDVVMGGKSEKKEDGNEV